MDSSFEQIREQVLPLVDYYLQTRYPDIGDFIDYTEPKAIAALRDATSIVDFVASKLD